MGKCHRASLSFEVSSLSERSGEKPVGFMESSQDLKWPLTRLNLGWDAAQQTLWLSQAYSSALEQLASLGSLEANGRMANYQQETGQLLTINYPLSVRVQERKEKHTFILFGLGLIQCNLTVFGLTLAFDL